MKYVSIFGMIVDAGLIRFMNSGIWDCLIYWMNTRYHISIYTDHPIMNSWMTLSRYEGLRATEM